MEKLDAQALTKSAQVIGQDRLVELKLIQPGFIISVWRVINYLLDTFVLLKMTDLAGGI